MFDTHEHVFSEGWIRNGQTMRACKCGVYDNPHVLASDFDWSERITTENPFDWKP
jgi:hypothetical protein